MTCVCSLMITDAMSSVMPKNSKPSPVKNASDRLRSLTGRLTNSLVGICGFPSLFAALTWTGAGAYSLQKRNQPVLDVGASQLTVRARTQAAEGGPSAAC